MKDLKKQFGLRLKHLRVNFGLTQEQLSEKIGLQAQTIGQIEVGRYFVSSNTIEHICQVFGITPKCLFDFSESDIHKDIDKDKNFNEIVQTLRESDEVKLKFIRKLLKIVLD